jgi:hypothetical protein
MDLTTDKLINITKDVRRLHIKIIRSLLPSEDRVYPLWWEATFPWEPIALSCDSPCGWRVALLFSFLRCEKQWRWKALFIVFLGLNFTRYRGTMYLIFSQNSAYLLQLSVCLVLQRKELSLVKSELNWIDLCLYIFR